MAYHRRTVFRTPLLGWQQLTLLEAASDWSDDYRVDSPRLLLPLTRCFECSLGDARFTCDAGAALWLTPEQPYRMRRPWVGQRVAVLAIEADLGSARRAPVPLATHWSLARWAHAWAAGSLEPLALEERLAALMQSLFHDTSAEPVRPHRAVERARDFIASEPARRHTLADIAQAVHCSPFHLARTFRANTGTSLHGFRTQLRLAEAVERLRDGERDLNALAADLGFSSHSHFSAVFRRRFGVPPSQLRTNLTAASVAP